MVDERDKERERKRRKRQRELLLVRGCIEGDKAAWDALVEEYSLHIYAAIYGALKLCQLPSTRSDVADHFQGVFLGLHENGYRKLRQFEGRCSLATWLRLVSRSTVIDEIRGLRKDLSLDAEDDERDSLHDHLSGHGPNPEEMLLEQADYGLLKEAIEHLTPREKELLELVCDPRMTPEQTAEELGISVGAYYTRKSRLVQKLSAWIKRHRA